MGGVTQAGSARHVGASRLTELVASGALFGQPVATALPRGQAASAAADTPAGSVRGKAAAGILSGTHLQSLLQHSSAVGAGLSADTRHDYQYRQQAYIKMYEAMKASGLASPGTLPARAEQVTAASLLWFMYHVVTPQAEGGLGLTPLTMLNYVRAVMHACENPASGWSFSGGSTWATTQRQHQREIFKKYRTFKVPKEALAPEDLMTLVEALDVDDDKQLVRAVVLLVGFWQGARGVELSVDHLRNVNVNFTFDTNGRPVWARITTYDTKAKKMGGLPKSADFYSQYHAETPVAAALDAVTLLHTHMERHGLLATGAELKAKEAWLKKPADAALPGREVFPLEIERVDADNITRWLKEMCKTHLPHVGPNVSSRSLRVGGVTAYADAGLPITAAMAQVGHESKSSHGRYHRDTRTPSAMTAKAQNTIASAALARRGATAAVATAAEVSTPAATAGAVSPVEDMLGSRLRRGVRNRATSGSGAVASGAAGAAGSAGAAGATGAAGAAGAAKATKAAGRAEVARGGRATSRQ
jgi:hypothetical protein